MRASAAGILACVLALSASGTASVAGATPAATPESDEIAYARELRIQLGLPADDATLIKAGSDQPGYVMSSLGIPLTIAEAAEADRRIRVQVGLDDAIAIAESSPAFAGAWIDQQSGGRVVFQFAGGDAKTEGMLPTALPAEATYETRDVKDSLRTIQERGDAILADLDELSKLGVDVTGVGLDIPGNRTSVTLTTATQSATGLLHQRYGDRLLIKEGGVAAADACPETGCTPLKAGIGMLGKGGGWPCTVGYLARRTDVSPDVFVIVTAGHCVQYGSGTSGDPWTHGSVNLGYGIYSPTGSGRIETYFNNSSGDVGLISIFSGTLPTTKNQVLQDDSPVVIRNITSWKAWNQQLVGSVVCRMGRTTGKQCGTISDNDEAKISKVGGISSATIQHTVVYGRDADGGDSGGTMFVSVNDPEGSYVVLYGTHVHSDDGYVSSGGHGWYTPVDRGIAQMQSSHSPLQLHACTSSSCP